MDVSCDKLRFGTRDHVAHNYIDNQISYNVITIGIHAYIDEYIFIETDTVERVCLCLQK